MLTKSQRDFIKQLSSMVSQIRLQSEASFDGKSWATVSWPQFADKWETLIKEQIDLLKCLRSGALPQWLLDQQQAYEASAIGKLAKAAELRRLTEPPE